MSASLKDVQEPTRGVVATFYSYKGGVGRSMAMANVAALLAKWGKKVLLIDWDLEAPGIEQFYKRWLRGDRRYTDGLIELIHSTTAPTRLDWHSCLLTAALPRCAPISILHAGKDDAGYGDRLRALDWNRLFDDHRLGHVLDELREQWLAEYDFVLIDSRTGITDIGGVCSIFLPDILVTLFTATEQSLGGVRDVMRSAREKHGALPVDRRRLMIVPIPSRDESGSEYKLAAEWRGRFALELKEFFRDWMPKDETPDRILNHLKIPYFPYWSFGEKLPAIEEDPDNPKTLAFSYQLVARLLLGKLDWEEVRKGTQATEASAAQSLVVQEKAAEALRIRAEAQQADAKREAARTEQDLKELKARENGFFFNRLSPAISSLRSGATKAALCFIAAAASGFAILWRGGFLLPDGSRNGNLNWESNIYLVVGVVAIVGGVLYVMKHRIRSRTAGILDREQALYEARAGEYSPDLLSPREAFTRFVEKTERLIFDADLRTSVRFATSTGSGHEDSQVVASVESTIENRPTSRDVTPNQTIQSQPPSKLKGRPTAARSDAGGVDVFVSYRRSSISDKWLREFVPLFREWLNEYLGRDANVFVDFESIQPGEVFVEAIDNKLRSAKCFIPVLSRAYFSSELTSKEWETAIANRAAIVPISLMPLSEGIPPQAMSFKITDFSQFAFIGEGFSRTEGYVEFQTRVRELARDVANSLEPARR